MNKQVVMLILVIAIVVLVGVQAYQISDLKSDIGDGTFSINSDSRTTENAVRTSTAGQQAAPTMVGGC